MTGVLRCPEALGIDTSLLAARAAFLQEGLGLSRQEVRQGVGGAYHEEAQLWEGREAPGSSGQTSGGTSWPVALAHRAGLPLARCVPLACAPGFWGLHQQVTERQRSPHACR